MGDEAAVIDQGEAEGGPKVLRRTVSSEGLHRLLGRPGLAASQRSALLARLGQRHTQTSDANAERADAMLQQSATGLELGRLLSERAALRALSDCHTPQPVDVTQFADELGCVR